MYLIYVDDICIHNAIMPMTNTKVLDPHLVFEDSAAGSLEFTITPNNSGYSQIKRYNSDVTVMELVRSDNTSIKKEIWWGRIASDQRDFNNNRAIVCEGALSFLSDTIQPRKQYRNKTITEFVSGVLSVHNSKVRKNTRKIYAGNINLKDLKDGNTDIKIDIWTDHETSLDAITNAVADLDAHISIRKDSNGNFRLDVLDDESRYGKDLYTLETRPDKKIEFGKNLMDFQESFEITNLITCVTPLGAAIEREYSSGENDGVPQEHYTIATVNHTSASDKNAYTSSSTTGTYWNPSATTNPYRESILAIDDIDEYGFYEMILNFDEEKNPETLYQYGKAYLDVTRFDEATYEIDAIDGKFLNNDISEIGMYDYTYLVSVPHHLIEVDGATHELILKKMPVLAMDIDLSHPGDVHYTLNKVVNKGLSDEYAKAKKAGDLPESR